MLRWLLSTAAGKVGFQRGHAEAIQQAQAKCDAMVAAAQERAEAIVWDATQRAETKARSLTETAISQGQAAGHAKGLSLGREQGHREGLGKGIDDGLALLAQRFGFGKIADVGHWNVGTPDEFVVPAVTMNIYEQLAESCFFLRLLLPNGSRLVRAFDYGRQTPRETLSQKQRRQIAFLAAVQLRQTFEPQTVHQTLRALLRTALPGNVRIPETRGDWTRREDSVTLSWHALWQLVCDFYAELQLLGNSPDSVVWYGNDPCPGFARAHSHWPDVLFPRGLPVRVLHATESLGVTVEHTVRDFLLLTEQDLDAVPRVGPQVLSMIRHELARHDLRLYSESASVVSRLGVAPKHDRAISLD